MKRLAFPMVVAAILVAGLMFSSAGNAARRGVSEDDLLRSGHTIDYRCGTATTGGATAEAEPMQLAYAIRCEEYSDGTCVAPGGLCGSGGSKKKKNTNYGTCTTVYDKRKQASCACVR